jgi:hypothetical protein
MLLLQESNSSVKAVALELLQHAQVAPDTLDTVQRHTVLHLLLILLMSTAGGHLCL